MGTVRDRSAVRGFFRSGVRPPSGAQPTDPYPPLIIAAAYFCGAIPTGLWLGRRAGVDVRATGSGNLGATNVARSAGLGLGLLTLIFDAGKGALPVLAARALGLQDSVQALTGLSAFFGHIFSVFVKFRGGKGIATASGVFLVLTPVPLAVAVLLFAIVFAVRKIVSLASLTAGLALPILIALLGGPRTVLAAGVVVAVTLAFTHRDNIRRLAAGTEPRFQPRRG